jgi:GntR family transcriptional regulator
VLAFSVTLRPGLSIHEQIVYAVTKAIVSGRLKPGDSFPSVRALSKELRVNPNTAHKVVATLVGGGLLEVRPGIGTVVAKRSAPTAEQRRALLKEDAERLVVEAQRLALERQDVVDAVVDHWDRLARRGR